MSAGFQGSFTGGELDPALSARVDISKYGVGCKLLKNFVVQAQGGAYRRPGLSYILKALGITRLIPFQYNVEQAYILAFSDLKMRVIKDGGVVLETGTNISAITKADPAQVTSTTHGLTTGDDVYISGVVGMTELNARFFKVTVINADTFTLDGISSVGYTTYVSGGTVARVYTQTSPYAEADIFDVHFAQSADTMYLTHSGYAPRTLTRSAHDNWTFTTVALGTGATTPTGGTASWNGTASSGYVYRYKITAINADGEESLPSAAIATPGTAEAPPGEWVADNFIGINVPSTSGAVEYNIYKENLGNGIYGYVGATINTGADAFRDENYTPDLLYGVPENYDPFSGGAGDYPGTTSFFKQRLWFGASLNLPQSFWASQVSLFNNFNKSSPLRDSDSLEFTLASAQVNAIKWLVPFQELLAGTSGAEWKIFASGGGAITPSTTDAKIQSYWGSTAVQPIIVGDSVVHVQAQGSKVRDLLYSLEKDSYSGNDLTVMVSHLFQGKTVVSWAFQRSPDSVLWCVMDDGSLLGMTYHKEHQVWGWHQHETDGTFEAVASIPGATYDDVYFVVNRTVGAATVRYIEKLSDKWRGEDGIENAMFLDSALSYSGSAVTSFAGLDHLEGETVSALVDGSPVANLVVTDGTITLATAGSVVHVGLPMVSTLAPMGVEEIGREAGSVGRVKSLSKIIVRFSYTVGGKIGHELALMDALKFTPDVYGEAIIPEELLDYEFTPPAGYDRDGSFYIRQDQPLPMTVLAIMPSFIVGGM